MKRRKVLSTLSILLGGTMIGTQVFLPSCKVKLKEETFTTEDVKLLDEIGETILPSSVSSPGAKAAKIGEFMKVYVTDCYNEANQKAFFEGINKFKNLSKERYSKEFLQLTSSQKHDLLVILHKEAGEYNKSKIKGDPDHYFSMMKSMILFGYFTSEPGATRALRYVQTPGLYNGNVAYKKGDKVWAT